MATSRFEMNQYANDRSAEVEAVYGRSLAELADPDGYVFNGSFLEPVTGSLFLTRALEVAEKTDRMHVRGQRLILIEWKEKRYVPVVDRAKQLLRDGYTSSLPEKTCANLAGVSVRTVYAYYQKFEMEEWRRGKVNDL